MRDIAPHGDLLDRDTPDFGIDLEKGVCVQGVGHMPGDPKLCREHAKRCSVLASQISDPVLKQSLTDTAQRWAVLATELETVDSLLEALDEPDNLASTGALNVLR
jgi:hypothetical protein